MSLRDAIKDVAADWLAARPPIGIAVLRFLLSIVALFGAVHVGAQVISTLGRWSLIPVVLVLFSFILFASDVADRWSD